MPTLKALAEQQARHSRGEPFANYVAMAKWLTAWRNAPGGEDVNQLTVRKSAPTLP